MHDSNEKQRIEYELSKGFVGIIIFFSLDHKKNLIENVQQSMDIL